MTRPTPATRSPSPPRRAAASLAGALFVAVAALAPIAPIAGDARADGAQSLPSVEIAVGEATLQVEIADDGQERYVGLGFRDAMDEDAGMLFVYPGERPLTFTMRDTRIPLSIAFVSEDLVINEIHDMPVGPNQLFPSERPAKYALETNLGWFERNGVEPGDRLALP